jgi:HTH-type transcriptional repressor of NAD biosynthesis genes
MAKSFLLLTAMPPTSGHLQLIQFASLMADEGTVVIVNTQPHEPLPYERVAALKRAVKNRGMKNVKFKHINKVMAQDPATPGFWDMWQKILLDAGVRPTDYIVASMAYGKKLAEITGSTFYPYDIDRYINPVKATPIREDPYAHFHHIIPEFQKHLRTTVTVFGAESTGKSTLSRQLAEKMNGYWLFEYARPYLEYTTNEITQRSMMAIWKGQAALQRQADNLHGKPYIVQDTDLFTTVGYWQFPHWQSTLGECPQGLVDEAKALQSDLYIFTRSNIPFEKDPLRYGGDHREGSDEYWLDVCKQYDLPYVVLESNDPDERLAQATAAIEKVAAEKAKLIAYDRHGL